MRIPVRIAVASAVAAVFAAGCAPVATQMPSAAPPGLREATVTHVVDGDTIDVRFADGAVTRVRLYGVDTPETAYGAAEPYGAEATAFAERTLAGRRVWIDSGDVERRDDTSDRRLLAWVWLAPPADASEAQVRGRMFNALLLTGGYADVYREVQDRTYVELLYRLEAEARSGRLGKWGP